MKICGDVAQGPSGIDRPATPEAQETARVHRFDPVPAYGVTHHRFARRMSIPGNEEGRG